MPSNNSSDQLKVLITRPEPQGLVLAQQLRALNIDAQCQPLFHYQPSASYQDLQFIQNKTQQPILIFISVAAVEFAQRLLPIAQWACSIVVSVGLATQQALKKYDIDAFCPVEHNSEGIINLPELSQVTNQDVIIVKGDSGRELIAHTLKNRGANVHQIDTYRRVWHNLDESQVEQWRNTSINCIVVTSNALLERIVHLLHETFKKSDNHWQTKYLWVVASKRIAEHAQQLGLHNVVNAHGASDKQIITTLLNNGIA